MKRRQIGVEKILKKYGQNFYKLEKNINTRSLTNRKKDKQWYPHLGTASQITEN